MLLTLLSFKHQSNMRIILLSFAIVLSSTSFAQEQSVNDQTPKATFIVDINGVEYILSEGEELKLDSTTVSVKLADYKKFDNGSISFSYPYHYGMESEQDFGYKSWTLDGNNFVIMYFEIDAETELDDFINEMVNLFGKENCSVEKTDLQLGEKKLNGKRINITLVGQHLTFDLLEIKMSDFKSRFIAFQDSLDDDKTASKESAETLNMIHKSIVYKQ